jgi:polysaccharide pyruvyl transferase WcaK-like protein
MSKIAFLINDTEEVYHWGCYGTSHAIKKKLKHRGFTDIISLPVNAVHKLGGIPTTVKDFGTKEEFINNFGPIARAIEYSSAVIINGEGTIHDFASGPRALLFFMYVSKHFFKKKVILINHSCYPNSGNKDVIDFYHAGYHSCDYVATRESLSSLNVSIILGKENNQAFDSLPLSIYDVTQGLSTLPNIINEKYICISGAVNYDFSKTEFVINELKINYPDHKFIYLVGSKKEGMNSEEPAVIDHLLKFMPDLIIFNALTFENWLSIIKHADLLISGRYHYSIAALCFTTPMIYFSSNTPKIEAISWDLQLPTVVIDEVDFSARLKELPNMKWESKLIQLCKLAEKNYSW